MAVDKEQARKKAEEIRDILTLLLNEKLSEKPEVRERSDGGNRKYYTVTWRTLGRNTFAAVNMKGQLTIHKSPGQRTVRVTYDQHLRNLEEKGFEIGAEIHSAVNNRYVRWDIPNLKEFVKLQFKYYTQNM